jgi:hypothetical protein
VRTESLIYSALLAVLLLGGVAQLSAQETPYSEFRAHNASMATVQPTWMGPLIQSDARLSQAIRISVSDANAPGEQILSYGNNHGISVIVDQRFQLDFDPPSFFRNHSAKYPDGFGNAGAQVKYRIASGDAEHGNFALTAIEYHGFAPRADQNAMLSAFDCPKIAAGTAWGRFDVQSTLGGVLPAGKVAAQGRAVEWNVTGQIHASQRTWLDVEDNAAFNIGGPFDGKTQNFITPAGFLMLRRKEWAPTHAVVVFDAGMQIATSSFHVYNHNLIAEARILF